MLVLLLAAATTCATPATTLQDLLFGPPEVPCPIEATAAGLHAAAGVRILAGRSGSEVYLALDSGDGRSATIPIAVCRDVHGDPDAIGGVVPAIQCDRNRITFDLTAAGLSVWDGIRADEPALTIPLPADVVTVNGHPRPEQ